MDESKRDNRNGMEGVVRYVVGCSRYIVMIRVVGELNECGLNIEFLRWRPTLLTYIYI